MKTRLNNSRLTMGLTMVELMKAFTHMRSLKSFKNFCRSSDWVRLDFLLLAFSCKRRHDDTTSSLCSIRCSCPSGNLPTRSSASFAIDSTFSPRALRSNCGETQYGKSGVIQVSIYDASRSMKEVCHGIRSRVSRQTLDDVPIGTG